MGIRGFLYKRPGSIKEASSILSRNPGKARAMAGGTDLLGGLKDNIHDAPPETVVDLKSLKGMAYVKEGKAGLSIGAMTLISDLIRHPAVISRYPLLAQASRSVASPQIRNMGTVGGNICQEPRCWYYRTPENLFHCMRKGGRRCPAFFGENRYHSIFGAARMSATACVHACPNHTEVPTVMAAVRRKDFAAAAAKLLEVNPMPSVTGRVCPHYCEKDCGRAGFDEAVSIREVERFVGDYALEHASEFYKAARAKTRKQAAVVGSGPAGLATAYFLAKAGHRVRVFERMAKPGGVLAYGIPAYRLPGNVLSQVVGALESMGVVFELNAELGKAGLSFGKLRRDHDAVFLGAGLWTQKTLGMEREELLGSGIRFLMDCREGHASCAGLKVLVIGGGSVAVDVAVSALRLGAGSAVMACLESRAEMPAFPEDIEVALLEKVDILPSWGPSKVIERNGRLAGMELVKCDSVFDSQKRFRPVFDPSVTKTVEADIVILAIGLSPDLSFAGKGLKLGRGFAVTDEETMATSLKGVFAGGDAVTGPASVVSALAAGRKAAAGMDAYLRGRKPKPVREDQRGSCAMLEFNEGSVSPKPRVPAPGRGPLAGKIDQEDRLTLAQSSIEEESLRCGNCGCVAVNASDLAPALVALGARVKTTRRVLKAGDFFASRPLKTTVLEPGELVTEVFVPAQGPGSKQAFLKFRLRKAIDFPIVSVASVLSMKDGRFKEASIALGAVGPVPMRALEVESFLKGKKPDETVADQAGEIAVRDCRPLARNGFKVQISRALLRKAVLSCRAA